MTAQEPTAEILDALVRGFPATSTGVVERSPYIQAGIRDTARAAYRTGYAAALGHQITVNDTGDRVHIGDPREPDPTPCRAEYERPGGRQHGDRIVRCHLLAGHPGEHEEANTEVTWIDPHTGGQP